MKSDRLYFGLTIVVIAGLFLIFVLLLQGLPLPATYSDESLRATSAAAQVSLQNRKVDDCMALEKYPLDQCVRLVAGK